MVWSANKTLEFIKDYQNYPLLWRTSHVDYTNRDKRRSAIRKLGLEYDLDCRSVLNKIKSLRSYFHREHVSVMKKMKSGVSGNDNLSSWFAYTSLMFILEGEAGKTGKDTLVQGDMTIDSAEDVIQEEDDDAYNERETEPAKDEQTNEYVAPPTKRKKSFKNIEDDMVTEAYELLESTKHSRTDQCKIFGDLVTVKLQSLPLSVRPIAQHRVLSALLEFEVQNNPPEGNPERWKIVPPTGYSFMEPYSYSETINNNPDKPSQEN